jgi:arginine deiminase
MSLEFDRLAWEIESLFDIDIQNMGLDPAIALNGVLTNVLDFNGRYKQFDPNLPPAGNFLFWRDTNHITADSLVTHKMFYPIRDQEVALAQVGFDALDIRYKPISIPGYGSIEGGDILPMEINGQLYAMIGTAERTSHEGVKAWYEAHEKSFSLSGDGIIPMMIQGPTSSTQDQMHLDTYAQQIAPGTIIHCGDITSNRQISILMRQGGDIVTVDVGRLKGNTFLEWIETNATHVYNMTTQEQLSYAPNVLVHGSPSKGTTVFVTRDGTPEVTRFIEQHAVDTVLLHMNELTKFYGGSHCATSETRHR